MHTTYIPRINYNIKKVKKKKLAEIKGSNTHNSSITTK